MVNLPIGLKLTYRNHCRYGGARERLGLPSLFCGRVVRWNSPYINHFISPDSIIPDQTNLQSWNRYSYVNNNPLRYTDPTGHMMDQGDMGGGAGCSDPKYCRGGKPKPHEELQRMREKNLKKRNSNPPFATVTPAATTTATPSISTYHGQQCTSVNTCLNNPVPSSTPNPAAAPSAPDPEFQNAVSSASPLSGFVPTDYGPDLTALYNSALGGLPILGYPASSLEQIAGNAVTGALSVGTNVLRGAVSAGINISNTIGTGVNNISLGISDVLNTSFGGLSPTLPIFYLPSNPLQPAGPLTS